MTDQKYTETYQVIEEQGIEAKKKNTGILVLD